MQCIRIILIGSLLVAQCSAFSSNSIAASLPRYPRSIERRGSAHNASLTSRITALLNTLKRRQDKFVRPLNREIEKPLIVGVDMVVRSMGPISEQHQEFSLDCYFRQYWEDSRLAFEPIEGIAELMVSSKFLDTIWKPDTFIRNGRKSYLHMLTMPNVLVRVNAVGRVTVSQRLTIRTRCEMYLRKFPMDSQACPIEIGSLGYYSNEVHYEWRALQLDPEMRAHREVSQYLVIGEPIADNLLLNDSRSNDSRFDDKKFSVLRAYFKLQRQQGFYILQIYVPCTLLVVMSWVSFWINKEASPARVALGIMTVLSMSTLGFGLRTDLPKVSHSTALDIYIITCFGFVFAAMVEYAVINYAHVFYIRKKVHELKGLESNKAIDSMRMFTASIMGARRETIQTTEDIALTLKQSKPWYRRPWFRKEKAENTSVFYRMAVKAAKAREKLKLRDPAIVVNRIDNVSKIAFPTVYIIFNILYWWAFQYLIPDQIDQTLKGLNASFDPS